MKRVVVTGLGALTPIGNTLKEYSEGLKNGVSGANMITRFDPVHFKTQFACEVKNFDATALIHKRDVRRMDIFTQFAIFVAEEAIQDSGIDLEKLNMDSIGVIWGSGIGGLNVLEENVSAHALGSGTPRYNPFMIPKMIPDIAPGMISIRYGFRGPNYATVSACASSTNAILASMDAIRMGRSKMIVTGGSEAVTSQTGVGGFNAMKALSTRNDDCKTASRPFDLDRDGFVLGEGAAYLILEEYEHAKKRGAKIYAD